MRARPARLGAAACGLALFASLVVPAAVAGAPAAASLRPDASRVAVGAPTPIPTGAARTGSLRATTPLSLRVVLEPRDPNALAAFIARVSSPSSPDHGDYLARGQFAARFGPTRFAIRAVRDALVRNGLHVTGLSPSHLVLSVRGTEGEVATTLHAGFSTWRLGDGRHGYRIDGTATLPAAIARDVAGIDGTSSLVAEHSFAVRGTRTPIRRLGGAHVDPRQPPSECAAAEQQLPPGTFTPEEEGAAYGMNAVWSHDDDGTGSTVALEEFAPYSLSDILFYDTCFGALPNGATSDPNLHNIYVDGGTSRGSAVASDEPTLDIEQLRALAPAAQVDVYEGPNNVVGPLDTLQRIASDDTAQIVSISWGICEQFSDHAAEAPIYEQLAAQGQTVFAASGDNGSSDCLGQSPAGGSPLVSASVDDPASQPLVTGVGGLTVTSTAPLHETVWNDCTSQLPGCLGDAGGGGVSALYPQPSWQSAPGVPTGSERGASYRDVPDLSVMGDPNTGMLAYYQGTFQPYGGTSMGPPLVSAIAADDLQACGAATFGFLNPLLYAMGRAGGSFDDVTTGTNAVATSTYNAKEYVAGPGYDMASGLGSPDPTTFLTALCNADATASASPPAPGASSAWHVTFHTGGDAYPAGTTVTLTAPPGTQLPASTADWTVNTSLGTDPPGAVELSETPGSSTDNVAALTVTQGAPTVGQVTIDATNVINPLAVGTASVGIADSVDALRETAPLALAAASPTAAVLSVQGGHPPITGIVDSTGVEVTATVTDAGGDVVVGQPLTFRATGDAVAHAVTAITDGHGQVRFALRDDRTELATVTVESGTAPLGSLQVSFTDPWRATEVAAARALGAITGIPSVVGSGHGTGFVAVARTATHRIALARSVGAHVVVSPLIAAGLAPVASSPTIARGGAWLYVAYRSAADHLVVLSNPVDPHGARWRVDDLTARGVVRRITGDPSIVVSTGAHPVLSVAVVDTSHQVVWVAAPLSHVSRMKSTDLSQRSGWGVDATGSVAQAVIGGAIVVFARSTSGQLVLLARDDGAWLADDLAQDAQLIGKPAIATGNPTAAFVNRLATVAVPSRGGLVLYVGTLGNWSASPLAQGAAGTSAPAGSASLPALQGTPALVVVGTPTELVCASNSGHLVELSSIGVSDPWSAYDLSALARLGSKSDGAVVVPGVSTSLLAVAGGRFVVLTGAS